MKKGIAGTLNWFEDGKAKPFPVEVKEVRIPDIKPDAKYEIILTEKGAWILKVESSEGEVYKEITEGEAVNTLLQNEYTFEDLPATIQPNFEI